MDIFYCLLAIAATVGIVESVELTFELPDNERMCFFENINTGIKTTLEFQVVTGGNYDVDVELTGPNGQILYKDVKKQYDTFTWTTTVAGTNKFCFSNEFSTFTHKLVYFDFRAGDEKPVVQQPQVEGSRLTQMESSAVDVHESMNLIDDYQTHHRLREAQGRSFAEDLNSRVMIWSISESIIVLVIGVGQVFVLRSFFTDKRLPAPVKT